MSKIISSFENRRKRKRIREANIDNDNTVNIKASIAEINKEKIKDLNPSRSEFKTIKLETSSFSDMKVLYPDNNDSRVNPRYNSWEYTLNGFDIRNLPYVTVEFVVKESGVNNTEETFRVFQFIDKGVYFTVEDLDTEIGSLRAQYIKKVTVHASVSISFSLIRGEDPEDADENDNVFLENSYQVYPVIAIPNPLIIT